MRYVPTEPLLYPVPPLTVGIIEEAFAEFGGQVNAVPYITAAESILIERTGGRWSCRAQGHLYHQKFSPPKQEGICDIDGSELYQRDDDKAGTVTNRIKVYAEQTAPLIAYYRGQNKLVEIDGTQPIEKVTDALLSVVRKGAHGNTLE